MGLHRRGSGGPRWCRPAFGRPLSDVVQGAFEFNATQPAAFWQPIEDGHAGIEFEIQFVCVGATISRAVQPG